MNHAGEITPLTRLVQPHAVAITTVGQAHIEAFADGEAGVARAKAEIFEGLTDGGKAVLNADNRWFEFLGPTEARARGAEVVAFGSGPDCAAQLTGFRLEGEGSRVEARLHGRPVSFALRQSGAHWGLMSLAALLMRGGALGVLLCSTTASRRSPTSLSWRAAAPSGR